MKVVSITNFTVVRGVRSSVPAGQTSYTPHHLAQDGFYQLEAITGCSYGASVGELLFRLSVVTYNQQIFQEIGLPVAMADQDGFYPIELLSPGIILPGANPRLQEVVDADYLLPPSSIGGVEIRNVGAVTREVKLALRYRKVKGVVWDAMLSLPRVENIFLDPRNIEHDNLEVEDSTYACEVNQC